MARPPSHDGEAAPNIKNALTFGSAVGRAVRAFLRAEWPMKYSMKDASDSGKLTLTCWVLSLVLNALSSSRPDVRCGSKGFRRQGPVCGLFSLQ